jgi:DNA-binding transcriptional ArsR family regulator
VQPWLNLKGEQEADSVMLEKFRIRVFRAVAQHLTFSRAAEELLLTQPAITQQIKALEDASGVPLFDRGGVHIALTVAPAKDSSESSFILSETGNSALPQPKVC